MTSALRSYTLLMLMLFTVAVVVTSCYQKGIG